MGLNLNFKSETKVLREVFAIVPNNRRWLAEGVVDDAGPTLVAVGTILEDALASIPSNDLHPDPDFIPLFRQRNALKPAGCQQSCTRR